MSRYVFNTWKKLKKKVYFLKEDDDDDDDDEHRQLNHVCGLCTSRWWLILHTATRLYNIIVFSLFSAFTVKQFKYFTWPRFAILRYYK